MKAWKRKRNKQIHLTRREVRLCPEETGLDPLRVVRVRGEAGVPEGWGAHVPEPVLMASVSVRVVVPECHIRWVDPVTI